jgi:hypothetical protein
MNVGFRALLIKRIKQSCDAGTAWSTNRYLNIELLKNQQTRGSITA